MVIVLGNQKGGVGKTTLATLFANYLTLVKRQRTVVLDMDYQRSLFSRYEKSKVLDNPELYEVLEVDLDRYPAVHGILKEEKDQIIIIDLPGKLDDQNLIPVIRSADMFIIPFAYDESSYESTALFTMVAHELNPGAKKFFVPNRLKGSVRYETSESVNADLSRYGKVTSPITDRVDFQRVTTRDLPTALLPIIENVFEDVITAIEDGKQ